MPSSGPPSPLPTTPEPLREEGGAAYFQQGHLQELTAAQHLQACLTPFSAPRHLPSQGGPEHLLTQGLIQFQEVGARILLPTWGLSCQEEILQGRDKTSIIISVSKEAGRCRD